MLKHVRERDTAGMVELAAQQKEAVVAEELESSAASCASEERSNGFIG